MANPHVLEAMFPGGWPVQIVTLVNAYEQAPADLGPWPAVRVLNAWGLSEVGDVAWRLDQQAWQIHEDMARLEVTDARPAPRGVIGELVVTDLTNRIMPLIRYRTGDIAHALVTGDGQVSQLLSVTGRRIAARGTALEGVDIMSVLVPHLVDADEPFRVRATATRVRIEVQTTSYATVDRLAGRASSALARVGVAAAVDVAAVDSFSETGEGMHEVFQTPAGGFA